MFSWTDYSRPPQEMNINFYAQLFLSYFLSLPKPKLLRIQPEEKENLKEIKRIVINLVFMFLKEIFWTTIKLFPVFSLLQWLFLLWHSGLTQTFSCYNKSFNLEMGTYFYLLYLTCVCLLHSKDFSVWNGQDIIWLFIKKNEEFI